MDRIEKAKERFMDGFNCSQAVFSAFASNFGLNEEMALRIASGLGVVLEGVDMYVERYQVRLWL
jgi:hypothetical protein